MRDWLTTGGMLVQHHDDRHLLHFSRRLCQVFAPHIGPDKPSTGEDEDSQLWAFASLESRLGRYVGIRLERGVHLQGMCLADEAVQLIDRTPFRFVLGEYAFG